MHHLSTSLVDKSVQLKVFRLDGFNFHSIALNPRFFVNRCNFTHHFAYGVVLFSDWERLCKGSSKDCGNWCRECWCYVCIYTSADENSRYRNVESSKVLQKEKLWT